MEVDYQAKLKLRAANLYIGQPQTEQAQILACPGTFELNFRKIKK